MKETHQKTFYSIREIVLADFTKKIELDINEFCQFLDEFETCLTNFNTKMEAIEGDKIVIPIAIETLSFKQKIHGLLEKLKAQFFPDEFEEEFEELFHSLNEYLDTFDTVIVQNQKPEQFQLTSEDKFPLRGLKMAKIFFYQISQFPVRVTNLFGEKRPPKKWKQRIPMRTLAKVHLKDDLALNLHQCYEDFYRQIAKAILHLEELTITTDQVFIDKIYDTADIPEAQPKKAVAIEEELAKAELPVEEGDLVMPEQQLEEVTVRPIKIDYEPTIKGIKQQIQELREQLPQKIEEILVITFKNFGSKFEKVGTVELLPSKYNHQNLLMRKSSIRKTFKSKEDTWVNSIICQIDTWLYHLDLKTMKYLASKEYFRVERTYQNRINNNIIEELQKLNDFIVKSRDAIDNFEGEEDALKKMLMTEKINVHKSLTTNLIPKTVNFIINQDLPKLVNQAELNLSKKAGQLPESRLLLRSDSPGFPVAASDSDRVNPRSMVAYETIPKYSRETKLIRNELFVELNKIQKFLTEINQIVEFTLESAIAVFQQPDSENKSAKEIAKEGLDRALGRMRDIHSELHVLSEPITKSLRKTTLDFNDQLGSLQELENINLLRTKLAAAKAMQSTQEVKGKVQDYLKNALPMMGFLIVSKWKLVKSKYKELIIRWGLEPAPTAIDTEIADYYAESQAAIAKLPFVYQRLFKLEPATDENFIEQRSKEMAKMKKAYTNWNKGFYAPVVVVSERGAGISTLILMFLRKEKAKYRIIKAVMEEVILGEEEFMEFLRKSFEKSDLENIGDVIDYLNNLDYKQIIVLEDLQQLFLKMVNGFGALKMLFELVSKTNTNVFWITSCTLHSWDYLHKTLDVSDYFAYVVRMSQLGNEGVIDAILKRHRVSGYEVNFLPTERLEEGKKYKKMPQLEQQSFLQEEYFLRLNNYAQSNISLAILYWLRSTRKVEGNTITIGLQDTDYSFLSSLSNNKIFVLYELLVHDGLTVEQLAEVKHLSLEKAKLDLLLLQDDGIIFNNDGLFEINMLLYRPIVRLLKAKNIIH